MKILNNGVTAGALTLLLGIATAQAQNAPIVKNTFDDGVDGWQGFGQTAQVSVTHDEHNVKDGKSALQVDYGINKGEINFAMLPLPGATLTKAKAFHFWIKTDQATTCAIYLQEKDGGRYLSLFATPKDTWQKVEVAATEFLLADGENDPKDPDGKLDLDQVEGLGVADLGQLVVQAPDTPLFKAFNIKTGPHTMYLSNFVVDDTTLPSAPKPAAGELILDGFIRPQLTWLNLGGATLARSTAKPLDGPGLQASYHAAADKISVFIRPLAHGLFANADRLMFSIASAKPAKLLVQVEQTDGNKFNANISTDGKSALQQMRIPFSDFTVADDSKDTHAKLDLKLVKSVMLADISGLVDKADQDNTLWLNNLRIGLAK